jgi:hypothetical protein
MGGLGVLVTNLVGSVQAQGYRPAYAPYTPAYVVPAPGCATPGTPPVMTPGTPLTTPSITQPGAPQAAPGMGAQAPIPAPADTAGSALGEAGSGALASAAPNMIGDLGFAGVATIRAASGTARAVQRAIIAQGAFKISENESPRPVDRVFITYNYFNNANNFGGPSFDLHREVIGFEKTFFDGNASFGARLPIFEKDGTAGGTGIDGIGDLTLIFKFAAINDPKSGNVLSGGLVVTVPTGRDITLADGTNINSVLLQPWVGGILNHGNVYGIGFVSAVIPTETKDASFISTDLGLGYRLYQCNDGTITQIIPTIEGHLTDPLNHAGADSGGLVGFPDQFTMTAGVHFGLCNHAFLTLAGAVPVSGPRPFSGEFIAQFNWRF